MNRRSVLGLVGTTATIGTSGCLQLANLSQRHKLWYVEVRNALNPATVDVRVRRNRDIVHEDTYELAGVESYDNPSGEARYVAGVPYVRFQNATWDTDSARFVLEYRMAHRTDWYRKSFTDVKTRNIGVTIDVGSREDVIAGVRVHEHDSEADAREIIEYVENERETYSASR